MKKINYTEEQVSNFVKLLDSIKCDGIANHKAIALISQIIDNGTVEEVIEEIIDTEVGE